MLHRYRFVALAILVWTLFGILIVAPGAYFILSYGLLQNAIAVGACLGAVIGLVVGIIGVSPVVSGNRVTTFRSVLLGSMAGAVIGVAAMLVIGGFPKRSQADLSLIFLGPASLAIGAMVGLVLAAAQKRTR
jgi:hypothetical protein